MKSGLNSNVIPGLSRNPVNNKSHRFRIKSGMTATIASGMTATIASGMTVAILSLTTLWGGAALAADPISTTSSTDLNVSIAEVISLQVTSPCANNGNLVLNITPTPTGSMSTCQDIIRVDTNTPGYSLSFKSSSSSLTHTSITSPTTPTIPPTNNGTTPAQLDLNSWGFAIPNKTLNGYGAFDTTYAQRTNASQPTTTDKYATTPTTDTEIAKLDTGNANNNTVVVNANTTVFFGTAADMNLVAGEYTTTLTYTAIGEVIPAPQSIACSSGPAFKGNIGNISTANFTSWQIGDTGIATDTRNNQQYCVGKLADNHIWMLNNLKLAPNTTLTNADTDLNTISSFSFGGHNSLISDSSTGDFDTPYVYGPLNSTNSGNGEDYDTSDPTSDHFGGYLYNWSAATAGESTTSMPGDGTNNDIAPNSICPKNWRLPKGGYYDTFDPNNEFDQLNAKMADYSNNQDSTYQSSSYNDPQFYDNWQSTGAFRGVFAGSWGLGFYGQGDYGFFWSSSAEPGYLDFAFHAYFDSSIVYPDGDDGRYFGFSLRCLLN